MDTAHYDSMREARKIEGQHRRAEAGRMFGEATMLANEHGLKVVRHSVAHYQVSCKRWVLNVYPGNQRLKGDENRKPPFIPVSTPWNLIDVVRACIKYAPVDKPEEGKPQGERVGVETIEFKHSGIVHQTPNGVKVDFGHDALWLPRSQVDYDDDTISMPEWLATAKDLWDGGEE